MPIASRAPHPALRQHVRTLSGWYERTDGPVVRDELPGGRIVLVVSFGPRMDIDGRSYGSFVAGLYDRPAHTEHDGFGHGIQAYLTPLGARRLFGMPMGELTGQAVELEDLMGPAASELAERLATAPDWATWIDVFERAIAARVLAAPPVAPELDWAWKRMVESDGAVAVAELAAQTGWSRRHLAIRCRAELGMPPKALARILRFERAVARLREGDDLAALALDAGYYDQAHFNRDFRAFTGATPTAYRSAITSVQDGIALGA
jgi:AraC-like DNA-binding protein